MELRKEERKLIQYAAEFSWKFDNCSSRPEIPRALRNANAHFPLQKLLPFPILSEVNPARNVMPTVSKQSNQIFTNKIHKNVKMGDPGSHCPVATQRWMDRETDGKT